MTKGLKAVLFKRDIEKAKYVEAMKAKAVKDEGVKP